MKKLCGGMAFVLALSICLGLGAFAFPGKAQAMKVNEIRDFVNSKSSMPNPDDWFDNEVPQEDISEERAETWLSPLHYRYLLDASYRDAVYGYIDLAQQDDYHMELAKTLTVDQGWQVYCFRSTADEDSAFVSHLDTGEDHIAQVEVNETKYSEEGKIEMSIYYVLGVSVHNAPSYHDFLEEQPAPEVSDSFNADLPDPYYYYGEGVSHTEEQVAYGMRLNYYFNAESVDACHAYARLLADGGFGLTLREKIDYHEKSHYYETYYVFDYNGSSDVNDVYVNTGDTESKAPVIVWIRDAQYYEFVSMYVYFGDGITFGDTGDRCEEYVHDKSSGAEAPVGGGSSSSSGSSSSGDSSSGSHYEWQTVKKDCPSCTGGRCPICGGSGWYTRYGERVSCSTTCRSCGGSGYIYQREYVLVFD